MLGVQLLGNEKITVKEYPEPTPTNENDLLIQVKASGICGSEMHGYRDPTPHASNGGHEVAGEVIDAGSSTKFKVGDRVGVHAVRGCGECRWCSVGKYTYCRNHIGGGGTGTHVERLAAPDHVCLRLPEDVPFDIGVLLTGDGCGVPYHVSQRLNTKGGDFVCVLGAGPVGLGNTIVQSFLGAEVIVIDINDYRLSLAKAAGATHTINSKETDPLEAITEITHGMLVDKCIEAAGRPETLRLAFTLVGVAGTIMCVGEQGDLPISPSRDLIRKDITLMGSWFYHYSEYPAMLDLYRRGLPIGRMITDHFPLVEAQTAFSKFADGQAGKVMLEP